MLNETFRILAGAISSSITEEVPQELTGALENNAFVFSGFKTYHSLAEVGLSLTDEGGGIKPFEAFQKEVERIDAVYNGNYLYAEYNHAVTASQMAAKWRDFERDGDRYDLQYRTAGDEQVREEHRLLHNITLPQDDPFWSQFLPPNGWNCRCTVVQVRRGKYPESDSAKSIEIGEEITAAPKKRMFRFNPGKELRLYPEKHPYYKAPTAVKKVVTELAKEITTPKEAVEFINSSDERKQWFERGFNTLEKASISGQNGYTDMKGRIALTKERLDHVLSGLNKLRRGGEVSLAEADALATFWHEITHNRNKKGNMHLTRLQSERMELANELVARHTLPEFYKAFGAKMQHAELQTDRKSTGYNTMVRNYCTLIRETGADYEGVIRQVKEHLFDGRYDQQGEGLVKALIKGGAARADGSKLKVNEAKKLLQVCSGLREEHFEEWVKKWVKKSFWEKSR